MDLQSLWFVLIAVLYIGYFVLEGFDLGVGILLPFLGTNDTRRRMIINTVGPHWDGNEVWLITAGGGNFCSFSDLVCHPVQRFLPAIILDAAGIDRPWGGL